MSDSSGAAAVAPYSEEIGTVAETWRNFPSDRGRANGGEMGKLADWCTAQPAWAVDAMQRAAASATLVPADIDALVNRIALAHGLVIDGEHPCAPFLDGSIAATEQVPEHVVLHSVGPLQGLDRLASDQILKFAVNGITIVFGENGSGKSGYSRALRQLCTARLDAPLQGNVFADGEDAPKAISYSYQVANAAPATGMWSDGETKPAALRGMTLLDTDNLRIYVEGKNEILYLPPEVACVGRLAELYQAAAARYRGWIDAATVRRSAPFGGNYQLGTTAGSIIAKLQIGTAQSDLPTEFQLRSAAGWTSDDEAELARLHAELVQGPAAVAARADRIAAACNSVAADLERNLPPLADLVITLDGQVIAAKQDKRRAADALATVQIGAQPIAATGSDTWRSLFLLARRFAGEALVRQPGEPFVVGDPCPLCQQTLDADAAQRLAAFDAFVEGKATQEADDAARAVLQRIGGLKTLGFRTGAELTGLLGEAADYSPEAQTLVQSAVAFSLALQTRRDARVRQLETEQIAELAPLPPSPLPGLRNWAGLLADYAIKLRSGDAQTAMVTARILDLQNRKQMHGQIEEIVARRSDLAALHLWKNCEAALNTGPLSRLMTALRKELTSPDLRARIEGEIRNLGLTHIPLKFADASDKGTSFFEVELATSKKAKKTRVLSEGEQRALSLACFLGETYVAGGSCGIILDDPVTSLDHGRVRRVARRLVDEAAKGRQIVIFTHNLVFYHELMLTCVDRDSPVPALPCLVQQGSDGVFGMVTIGDEPWVARKVKEREASLKQLIDAIPDGLATSGEAYRRHCTGFFTALRETWERAVEEIVLNDVVRRFGSDVGTLRLGGVDVSDEDFAVVHRAMKRASEHSGHDQAAGRQIDIPTKEQMQADLYELMAFRTTKTKSNREAEDRRRTKVARPPAAATA